MAASPEPSIFTLPKSSTEATPESVAMYADRNRFSRFGTLLGGLLVVELAWAVLRVRALSAPVAERGDAATVSSVRELGRVLFTDYSFAFEATSILILVAMVGAVVLARREADQ